MKILDLPTGSWRKSSRSGPTGGQCIEVAAVRSLATACDAEPPTNA
ncbi:DUF397 domain-containing protein [Actinoallomurus purpureus]